MSCKIGSIQIRMGINPPGRIRKQTQTNILDTQKWADFYQEINFIA